MMRFTLMMEQNYLNKPKNYLMMLRIKTDISQFINEV
jgi:hypothetical protein